MSTELGGWRREGRGGRGGREDEEEDEKEETTSVMKFSNPPLTGGEKPSLDKHCRWDQIFLEKTFLNHSAPSYAHRDILWHSTWHGL